MPRKPTYANLAEKFRRALRGVLNGGIALSKETILESVREQRTRWKITEEECDRLDSDFGNHMTGAKNAGLIARVGSKSKARYRLCSSPLVASDQAAPRKSRRRRSKLGVAKSKQNEQWEAFAHLPATVALSQHFGAWVESLPTALDSLSWGNPDMLMIRRRLSATNDEGGGEKDATRRTASGSVLASIEVKANLRRGRRELFSAIAETAANSLWADEAWLVIMEWEPNGQALADEVRSFARTNEVGIIEVRCDVDDMKCGLELVVHEPAATRATRRNGAVRTGRPKLLKEARDLEKRWTRIFRTVLPAVGSGPQLLDLIQQAMKNLTSQRGFVTGEAEESLKVFRQVRHSHVNPVLKATLRNVAPGAASDQELAEAIADIKKQAAHKLKSDQGYLPSHKNDLLADLKIFERALVSKRS